MNDFRDVKAIAEACQQHQPLRFMPSHGALYIRNDNGIVFDVHQNRSFPEFMAQNKDYADLVLAANPSTILALIAENESAHKHRENESNNVQALMAEVLRLKAENEALKKRIDDMSPFKGAPLTGPDLRCLACGGYHYGIQGLPCPNMRVTASAAMGKGEQS